MMRDRHASRASGAMVVALHAVVILAALHASPWKAAIVAAVPLTVSLLPTPAPPAPAPRIQLPMPRLAEPPRDPVALPAIQLANAAASSVESAAPRAATTSTSSAQPASFPAALPVVAPIFNADYLDNPAPSYPALSRRLNEEGRVLLRVHVSGEGRAERVELARSSGFERLDRAALEAVARWRFVPARQGGNAVAASVLVPVAFVLRS